LIKIFYLDNSKYKNKFSINAIKITLIKLNMKEFGHRMKQECYQLDTNITFCNHGSYGSVPNTIFDKKVTLQREMENCPDKWFRKSMFDKWESNRKLLADYLKVNSENLFICDSATEGINCLLKSIDFNGSQDAILCSQYTYQGINKLKCQLNSNIDSD